MRNVYIMHGCCDRDEYVQGVTQSVEKIRDTYPNRQYHEFKAHGHFNLGSMKTDAFPELLAVVT